VSLAHSASRSGVAQRYWTPRALILAAVPILYEKKNARGPLLGLWRRAAEHFRPSSQGRDEPFFSHHLPEPLPWRAPCRQNPWLGARRLL